MDKCSGNINNIDDIFILTHWNRFCS